MTDRQPPAATLAELIGSRVVLSDGATGTLLHAMGNSFDQALVELNLSDPEAVRAVHDSYLESGVDLLQTNTFGASRLRLASHGLDDQVVEINTAGVRIARQAAQAADRGIFVVGSVSPALTGGLRRTATPAQRAAAVAEQVGSLVDAGVDAIILEAYGRLDELVEAVDIAIGYRPVPVIAQATFAPDGNTASGHTPREVAEAVGDKGLLAIGLNCTLGPRDSLAVLREIGRYTDLPLIAQPNAGLPRRVGVGRFEYEVDSDYFARCVHDLVDAGARLVGGCCGTTPDHIRAVARTLSARPVQPRPAARVGERQREVHPAEPTDDPGTRPAFVAAVHLGVGAAEPAEVGQATEQAIEQAQQVREAGVDVVVVAPDPLARVKISTINVAAALQDRASVSTAVTLNSWNRSIMALQAQVLGAHSRGVRRIICRDRGPLLVSDYPSTDGRWDVDAAGLVRLLVALNDGVDHNGMRLSGGTDFEIGAWINPGARNQQSELADAEAKIAAGATFLVTGPVYEATSLAPMLELVDGRVPVLLGVRPLTSFQEAEYLRYEIPDVVIPDEILTSMADAGSQAPDRGLELTIDLLATVRDSIGGLVIDLKSKVEGGRLPANRLARLLDELGTAR